MFDMFLSSHVSTLASNFPFVWWGFQKKTSASVDFPTPLASASHGQVGDDAGPSIEAQFPTQDPVGTGGNFGPGPKPPKMNEFVP